MSQPISDIFSYYGRKPNQFFLHELQEMLCPDHNEKSGPRSSPLAFGTARRVNGADSSAEYALDKSADGKDINLRVQIQQGGKTYTTAMTAAQVRSDNLYEIKSLVFDNKPEKLGHRWEISSVLGFIGRNHLEKICEGKVPTPHEERGQFGKIGRFLNRALLDNPHAMWHPPY